MLVSDATCRLIEPFVCFLVFFRVIKQQRAAPSINFPPEACLLPMSEEGGSFFFVGLLNFLFSAQSNSTPQSHDFQGQLNSSTPLASNGDYLQGIYIVHAPTILVGVFLVFFHVQYRKLAHSASNKRRKLKDLSFFRRIGEPVPRHLPRHLASLSF